MNSNDIWFNYGLPQVLRTVATLDKAIPWLRYVARSEVAERFEIRDTASVTKEQIHRYLLNGKEYDSIEIGKIVTYCNNRS